MHAAVMHHRGERPMYGTFLDPQTADGSLVVTVRAAALSGFDKAVARGVHYFKMPAHPFVVGREGVGQPHGGARVYFNSMSQLGAFGSMAERTLIDPQRSFPVPDIVPDDVAAALGNAGLAAWLALSWRAKLRSGERVLILGATGASGRMAVTAAKRLGASLVVAAGRNKEMLERTRRLGADRTVDLNAAANDLVAAFQDAVGGTADVVIDYLCGPIGEAALDVLSTHGRFVHVGTAAALSMAMLGTAVRRTCADIMGFAYYHAPIQDQAQAYNELCRLAAAGELAVDLETRPLSEIGAAWDAHGAGDRRRQVLVPSN